MGNQNRLFMTTTISLIILLGVALLGIGAWALVVRPKQSAVQAEEISTAVAAVITSTPTATATLPPPATKTPRPTNTPVIPEVNDTPTSGPVIAQPTETPAPVSRGESAAQTTPTGPPEETVPQTGFGTGGTLLAGVVLVTMVFGARRLRHA